MKKQIFSTASLLVKGSSLISLFQKAKEYIPQETQDKIVEKVSETLTKGKAAGINALETYAPDVVKQIVDRNAPKQPTAKEIAAEVKKALGMNAKKAAAKTGPKQSK